MKLMTFSRTRKSKNAESGQAFVFVLLGLSLFLIGAIAFAVDLSNLWFQRQAVQTAADAACTAGAMDMLLDQTNNLSPANQGNFTVGTNLDCSSTSPNSNTVATNPTPCVYAALNGYTSNLTLANATSGGSSNIGNNVYLRFNGNPPPGVSGSSFLEVDVTESMPTFFAGLLGSQAQSIKAISKCGIAQVAAPIPLLVLDPLNPDSKTSAFFVQGNPSVTIYGGPQQSIQVNSIDAAAVNIAGSALVDLSQGGPANPPTGSNFGVYGGPTNPPTCGGSKGFCEGTTGQWMAPHSPIGDPLQNVISPTTSYNGTALTTYTANNKGGFDLSSLPAGLTSVADGVSGCSSTGGNCVVFQPGNYPKGICLGNSCGSGGTIAHAGVFVEGLYYIGGTGFTLNSNSCARMYSSYSSSTSAFYQWGGVMFYFSGTATLNVAANAGDPTSANSCDSGQTYNTTSGGPTGFGVSCDSNSQSNAPTNLPATLTGNALLAPCKGPWGDPYLAASLTPPPVPGTQRGILFFQDRSAEGVQSTAGGGGTYAMAGTFYFHSCSSTAIDGKAGTSCSTPTGGNSTNQYYNDTLAMTGNTGASSYILGEIIVDNINLGGKGSIYMDLDPSSALNVYKAALYQ